jgi:hypothetical protein
MSIADIMRKSKFTVGIATQTSIADVPVDNGYTWVDCEIAEPTAQVVQYEADRSVQSVGASNAPLPGRVHWDFALKFAAHGQAVGYTAGTPEFEALMGLLAYVGQGYDVANDGNFTSTDANTVSVDENVALVGCLLASRETAGVLAMGFVKSIAGSAPWVSTLFEDTGALAGGSALVCPTTNRCTELSSGNSDPIAVRVVGENVNQDAAVLGSFPTSITIAVENQRLMVTANMRAYGEEILDNGGGLKTITQYQKLDPVVGRGGARWTLGSQTYFTSLNDGTIDPEGICDIRNLVITINFDHIVEECPTAPQGVGAVAVQVRDITVDFALPAVATFRSSNPGTGGGPTNEYMLVDAWNTQTPISFALYQGKAVGKIFALAVRAGLVAARPEVTWIDDRKYIQAQLKAGHWSGDGVSTSAGNKALVVSTG